LNSTLLRHECRAPTASFRQNPLSEIPAALYSKARTSHDDRMGSGMFDVKSMRGGLVLLAGACAWAMTAGAAEHDAVRVRSFLPGQPMSRALRPAPVVAIIENNGAAVVTVKADILLPPGVKLTGGSAGATASIEGGGEARLAWNVEAQEAMTGELRLRVVAAGAPVMTPALQMQFLPPVPRQKLAYIPEPVPVRTSLLIGAHNCPLWEAGKFSMWDNVLKHPERTPALGFYAQENPEVADWETKWAVEHGVSFFIYCWYRDGQGGAVRMNYGSASHDALFKSKFAGKMKFTLMWENQNKGHAGVADEKDLMTNLLPFWIENYFKHPGYQKVDNKPLLFIYRPEFLVKDLGGIAQVKAAFARMRQACRDAGFDGLHLLGEYRGLDPKHLELMKQLGLDYTFAYCWGIPNSPTPEQAIQAQMKSIRKTQALGILPQVVTVSQAWSGWRDEGSIWKIPPADFENLLRQAKDFTATLPPGELGGKMLLLDNWNEWGEGHYIAPYREHGFGYLDAVRKVFADAPGPHVDLIPEDIGLGPYDTAFHAHARQEAELKKLVGRKILKGAAPEPGLVGWWAFDEKTNSPVAFDCSGHGLGGKLRNVERAPGIDGRALDCRGGSVEVADDPLLSPASALTLECWVKTGLAGQKNAWFVNRVSGADHKASTGFRFGLLGGKPCFEVPLTTFSHHLTAGAALPLGRWVHLAGTFDGRVMRLYVDGEERGTMERPGPLKPGSHPLCLGNYEVNHAAYFTGLLDEVKLYDRALTPEEVRTHHAKFSKAAGAATSKAGN